MARQRARPPRDRRGPRAFFRGGRLDRHSGSRANVRPSMKVLVRAAALAALCAFPAAAVADEQPTNTGPLTPSETQFVQSVQKDLMARFPRVSDAEKAGYVRYTAPDNTGAISYA